LVETSPDLPSLEPLGNIHGRGREKGKREKGEKKREGRRGHAGL
jgi:hypothetical protein